MLPSFRSLIARFAPFAWLNLLLFVFAAGRLFSPMPPVSAQPVIPDIPPGSLTPAPGWKASDLPDEMQSLTNRVLGNVLYYQYQNSNYYVSVQDVEAAINQFDSEAADDFMVPTEGWSIGGIYVTGGFSGSGFTPTTTVDVIFYLDDNGLPGAVQGIADDVVPISYANGDILAKFPVALSLTAGHYWVSLVPRFDISPNGQWAWEWNLTQSNHPSVYRNPGNGYNTGCVAWIALKDCLAGWGPDLSFVLYAPLLPPTATPTLTPTLTETPTPTETLTVTPTLTLTPTETEIPSIELLANGDFEDDVDANKIPDQWEQKLPTGDSRKCSKPGKIIAYTGNCAYQFKSAPGENSQLRQDVDLGLIAPLTSAAGDVVTLRGYVTASGMVNARISFRVIYATEDKIKIKTAWTTPSDTYAPFISQPLTLIDTVTQIRVQLKNVGTSGKIRFDTLSLGLIDNAARLALP